MSLPPLRATNQETPRCSPLPSRSRDAVEILVPRDATDPLNLRGEDGAAATLLSPPKSRRRHRYRQHGGGGEKEETPARLFPPSTGPSGNTCCSSSGLHWGRCPLGSLSSNASLFQFLRLLSPVSSTPPSPAGTTWLRPPSCHADTPTPRQGGAAAASPPPGLLMEALPWKPQSWQPSSRRHWWEGLKPAGGCRAAF